MVTDNDEAKNYLMEHRTSEAISSRITEKYFEDTFLVNAENVQYTGGWYFDCNSDSRIGFVIKDELSPTDMEIAENTGIDLWKIGFAGETITLERHNGGESCSVEEFVAKKNLKEKKSRQTPLATQEERSKKELYCDRLAEDNRLIKTANIALIEDSFLNKYYRISDVDYIVKNELGYLALDIKFKYPSRNGSYGINVGPFGVFGRLAGYGFKIYNIVLKNEDKENCIDFLERGDKTIQYAHIDTTKDYKEKESPTWCSYFGNEEQAYKEIPGKEYRDMNLMGNIIDLKCPLCGSHMLERASRYGVPFLGCSMFPKNGCKGKINL
jgi:hypothetical protein